PAEDGIRDFHVTGVQTCALPISIDVASDGIDLLAFSGHKALLGPTGTGALVVSERVPLDDPGDGRPFLAPSRFGGSGHDSLDPRSEERRVGKECRVRTCLRH